MLANFDYPTMLAVVSIGMMAWACVEVGSNDAANLVNAVFGARILRRRKAVILAGIFVVLGASFSNPVMDTVRKGIFDLSYMDASRGLAVFITAYFVNNIILNTYSGFGLPISTTATLVFSLAGAALGVTGRTGAVDWQIIGNILSAMLLSVVFSAVSGFLVQRILRGAIRKDARRYDLVILHGPWIAGALLVSLTWFMLIKGLKQVVTIDLASWPLFDIIGSGGLLILLWAAYTVLIHIGLAIFGKRATDRLFEMTAIIGMACMAFSFGQNDLANCASPGIAVWLIWSEGFESANQMSVPTWILTSCGVLMFVGMGTRRASRVTQSEVATGSQQHDVALYSPKWCQLLARRLLRYPKTTTEEEIRGVAPSEEVAHYDSLRASVILAVSACVISMASSLGLPISTTYVSFAAVVATGWGDRVYSSRDSSDQKIGRALWVIAGWVIGAAVAGCASMVVAMAIYHLQGFGLALAFAFNLVAKRFSSRHIQAAS